jgi:hypothetical protein
MIVLISLPGLSSTMNATAFLMEAAAQTVFQRGRTTENQVGLHI